MKYIKLFEEFTNELQEYEPETIKNILWNAFKTNAKSIDFNGLTSEGNYEYVIIPEKTMTNELANNILGELDDSDLFDVTNCPDNSILIIYKASEQ